MSLLAGSSALAQSTAGQVTELIVTGHRTVPSTQGLATQVNEAKDESIVGQAFIQTQQPSANIGQLINMLPGVSYSTEDPAGFNSGDLRIHGFDGNHVAVILDGAPLNDTGNYAVYPGEYMIGELIDHITVNIGSSDVDSPSASALGATINVVSKLPPTTAGGQIRATGGDIDYRRLFAELDSGAIGPWGTRAYVAGEYGRESNFEGRPGDNRRWDVSGRIYQPLNGSDFLSLAGIFVSERQYPAFRASPTQLAQNRFFLGDNYTWVPETATPGKADTVPTNVGPAGNDNQYWKLFPNPVDFASVRGQSRFTLAPNLVFTFDPSFFFTLANGGGSSVLSEKDKRLIGNSHAAGVDLNGDGDVLDSVVAYTPSNTETQRYGLTTSLLWDVNKQNTLQLAYTLDYGRHRQTGEATYVDPNTGDPLNVFGARPGYGTPIATADGSILRTRDRFSVALLNQISANYIGRFADDRLHVNLGVRMPFFRRDLNQYCYTYNGGSAWCDTIDPSLVQAAYNADLAANRAVSASATALSGVLGASVVTGINGVPNFRFPFKAQFNFHEPLPNAGVTFRLAEHNLLYASYAKGFAAPKTDDLYLSTQDLVQPETSDNYAVGYRYQTSLLTASINLYDDQYHNRIVSSADPNDPTLTIDRNVGDAKVYGVDIEAGLNPNEHWHFYGSANFNKSELQSNYTVGTQGLTLALPVKGKELVLTPDREYALRGSYTNGPLELGAEAKYTGRRFISDLNDASIPAYTVVNLDGRWYLPFGARQDFIQFNVLNVFNTYYVSRSTTFANLNPAPIPGSTKVYSGNTPAYYIGAPRTFSVTLGAVF